MRSLPEEFEAEALVASLEDGWGLAVETSEYAAVGGGSYHWIVGVQGGTRVFVTVDDLDQKPWLGDTREAIYNGLRRAFDAAVALSDAGLGFVVAPVLAGSGESVRRVGSRYSIALFPLLEGTAGQFGTYDPAERTAVQMMLAELHQSPLVASLAHRIDLGVPGRAHLESALRELNDAWLSGPFSELARRAFARHATDVVELLGLADRLATEVATHTGDWVVTHGEPHAANVMQTDRGYVLIDWDTVAVAPPERDLWMLERVTGQPPASYTDATGYEIDRVAMDLFRLLWDLSDLAAFTRVLRSCHRENADTAKAHEGLTYCLAIRERWATELE